MEKGIYASTAPEVPKEPQAANCIEFIITTINKYSQDQVSKEN